MNRKKVNRLIGKIKRQARECNINDTLVKIKLTRADMRYLLSDINVYRDVVSYIIKLQDDTVFKRLLNAVYGCRSEL